MICCISSDDLVYARDDIVEVDSVSEALEEWFHNEGGWEWMGDGGWIFVFPDGEGPPERLEFETIAEPTFRVASERY